MRANRSTQQTRLALLVGLLGTVSAILLPFAPVLAETTTLRWPAPGRPAVSTSALLVPYRPTAVTVSMPCSALRAAAARAAPVVVLATGADGDGMAVTAAAGHAVLRLDGHELPLFIAAEPADCRITIESVPGGLSILEGQGRTTFLPDQPVPEVFGFHTDLDPPQSEGLTVTAVATGPFATTPTLLKSVLVAVQLLAVIVALILLSRGRSPPEPGRSPPKPDRAPPEPRRPGFRGRRHGGRRLYWIDLAMIATFCGWAVVGPLAVDDGWATMIARNVEATGSAGNYYRWWNAAEVPFAFTQQLLAPLTQISIAPLWLRLPSTLLGIATWFVLSRGVLGAALPAQAATAPVRLLAALCLLVAWLPFNLGTRPESYVALGVTTALALAWRAQGPAGLGWLALVVGLTVPASPTGILVAAPILVFATRLVAAARTTATAGLHRLANVALLCCVGAIGFTVIFADQTWDGLITATDWHTYFGPSQPWYEEPTRYRYLLQADQQGSFAKRLPVLVTIALLPIVGALTVRRRDNLGTAAVRLAAVVVAALLLLALGPSKWSYHFGAAAGIFASFLTVAVVLLIRRSQTPDRSVAAVGVAGSVLIAAVIAIAFSGPNAWWLPAVYDLPWPSNPVRPGGLPLNNPLLWAGLLGAGSLIAMAVLPRERRAQMPALGPAVMTLVAFGAALALLVGSFVAAPLRRSAGSLAWANLNQITSTRTCGLADDIELLPDGAVLRSAEPGGQSFGFAALSGFYPGAPPPDPPGTQTAEYLWGSRTADRAVGEITTGWFVLPDLAPNAGVALSVSGRTSGSNSLSLEFGRANGTTVAVLGSSTPIDRPASDEDPEHPLWRSLGVDSADVPVGADRVRVHAVDGRTDEAGWLAFTGPRLRSTVPLNDFLADNGPVLISWPQSFLFPCVQNIAAVSGGLAQTPRTVVESPRPWFTEDRNPDLGGTFAGLAAFGQLNEIPSRLIGHPDVDWGSVLVSGDTPTRDNYVRSTTREVVSGIGATRGPRPER